MELQMLTPEQAKQYATMLHPALAGYYHDGMVNQSDALAAVFHLIKQGYLEPEFKDHNITHGLTALRRTAKKPLLPFEQVVIETIFADTNHVLTPQIGDLIKAGGIQTAIITALNHVPDPLASLNSTGLPEKQEVVSRDSRHRRILLINTWYQPPFFLGGIALFILGISKLLSGEQTDGIISLVVSALLVLLHFLGYHPHRLLNSQVIILPYNQRYSELHDFLNRFPPAPHTFTYEYIPYAIAFGIDTSWHADFGLTVPTSPASFLLPQEKLVPRQV